jgi:hypothetical protein
MARTAEVTSIGNETWLVSWNIIKATDMCFPRTLNFHISDPETEFCIEYTYSMGLYLLLYYVQGKGKRPRQLLSLISGSKL